MPRVLSLDRCPHCKESLEHPTPRSCPHCGGSLQLRYLSWGCITSKPMVLLVGLGLVWHLLH
jgi:hypothetical protein